MSPKGSHAAKGSFARDVTKRGLWTVLVVLVVVGVTFGVVKATSKKTHTRVISTSPSLPSASVDPTSTVPSTSPSSVSGSVSSTADTADTPTTTLAPPTPSSVTVVVLNGTSTAGAAAYFTDKLRASGYNTLNPVDASTNDVTSTVVVVTPTGTLAGGDAIAGLLGLPSSAVTAGPPSSAPIPPSSLSGANVVVLVGSDIAGQATGQSSATATSTSTPDTSSSTSVTSVG